MRELADSGQILPTDTVWKEGIEKGVLASKVKHLFAPAFPAVVETPPVPVEARPEPVREELLPIEPTPPVATLTDPPIAPLPPPTPVRVAEVPRKRTAKAGKGSVLVGQDGVNVKYRKICVTCGHADSSWNTMPIRNGMMRVGFYCPKCRKHRDVEVHGSLN